MGRMMARSGKATSASTCWIGEPKRRGFVGLPQAARRPQWQPEEERRHMRLNRLFQPCLEPQQKQGRKQSEDPQPTTYQPLLAF